MPALMTSTELPAHYAWALLGGVLLLTCLVLWLRPSVRRFTRGVLLFGACGYAAMVVLWLVDFPLYHRLIREHHLVEWLTAHLLLIAVLFGLAYIVNRRRNGMPAPGAVFLVTGYFAALCRELEWGEPFCLLAIWCGWHSPVPAA